jgi:hypothetical protein
MTRYVARKRLKLPDRWAEIGDEVPEAAGWRNLHSYLNTGALREVADQPAPAAPAPAKRIRISKAKDES